MGTPELYIYAPQARWETVLLGDSLVQDVQSCSSAVEWDEHKSDTRTAVFKLQRCHQLVTLALDFSSFRDGKGVELPAFPWLSLA